MIASPKIDRAVKDAPRIINPLYDIILLQGRSNLGFEMLLAYPLHDIKSHTSLLFYCRVIAPAGRAPPGGGGKAGEPAIIFVSSYNKGSTVCYAIPYGS
jgi:hypothetical protein